MLLLLYWNKWRLKDSETCNFIFKQAGCSLVSFMFFVPAHLHCWESPDPWRRGWSPAGGEAGGCDLVSSRTALMPVSWTPMSSRSPAPSPRASDSTSCDYKGSGTCGEWEGHIWLGKVMGWEGRGEGGGEGVWLRGHRGRVCVTHLNISCSITSSQYKPINVRNSARDTVPSWGEIQKDTLQLVLTKFSGSHVRPSVWDLSESSGGCCLASKKRFHV